MKSKHLPRGFTLVELLISLGIIATLCALLFVAVGSLRAMAQRTSCASQLRQIYVVLLAYAQDHRGYLPRGGTGNSDDRDVHQWLGIWLHPQRNSAGQEVGVPLYAGGQTALNQLVVCPVNRALNPPAITFVPTGYPYVCNYELMSPNGQATKSANIKEIDAARNILLLDSAFGSNWTGPGFTARAGWVRIEDRHAESLNILWADGRVSTRQKRQLTENDMLRHLVH